MTNEVPVLTTLPEVVKSLLQKLPSRRMRDVLEKRFGLKGGEKKTLEAIGKEYKITRERVRQIEADALKLLSKDEHFSVAHSIVSQLQEYIRAHGGVMAEHHLLKVFPDKKTRAYVEFLMAIGKQFSKVAETSHHYSRWTVDKNLVGLVEKVTTEVVQYLDGEKHPVPAEKLRAVVAQKLQEITKQELKEQTVDAYLATAKLIAKNPYGDCGLVSWSEILPRGVRDKAYLVLQKSGAPLHFRAVAEAINKAGWSNRKAHPQTVHNELIKDSRFVLVGRGLYALSEWGYQPGAVKDIIVSVLKGSSKPLHKDDIVRLVSEKRMVKVPTILLNLNNRSLFKRVEGEKYTLV